MSRILSSTGLITGIPIQDTVDKLMAIAARPRDLITSRNKLLEGERLAIQQLTSLVVAFQFEVNRFTSDKIFQAKTVTSSNTKALTAAVQANGKPVNGTYNIRTLQTAASQQIVSSSFNSLSDLASEGTLALGFGGFVDKGISLDQLNGGNGVQRGQIRITDRDGNVADIDLRIAHTVDDVLNAINSNSDVNVKATVVGESFQLTDESGGTGNLKVSQIGTGTTASNLGLSGINIAADTATGADVFTLHAGTKLSFLNDGTGVQLASGNDLQIGLADGTTLNVDLGSATTLGDIIGAINAADPAKISAAIAADGNRLELSDLTVGAATFEVTSAGSGDTAADLGLTNAAVGGTITGGRLASGLKGTLVSSLRGGQGLGTLGQVDITNRNSVTSNVDLSAAETLSEIISAINAQATGVTAAINAARNGIVLTDTTLATANNLVVADGDANNTATALGIVVDDAVTTINSGTLGRKQLSRATLLSSLNNGDGVDIGDLLITDSNGTVGAVDLNTPGDEAKTLGDVIDRINALVTSNVEAVINATGDGILLIDHANGPGALKVEEVGNHTTAKDLRLLGPSTVVDIGGTPTQVIDGTASYNIDLSDLDGEGATIQLASLNNGNGVSLGSFQITDTNGKSAVIVLNSTGGTFNTVGDVIEAINAKTIGVEARINDAGTGILLFDTAFGSGTLDVEDLAGGTTASDLGLAKDAVTTTIDDVARQAINGAGTFSQSSTQNGLAALAAKINNLDAGVTASTVFDGVGYRLTLNVENTGAGNELLVDGLNSGLNFEQLSAARDAVIEFGGTTFGSGIVITSHTNEFDNIIPGLDLNVVAPSTDTVTVNVGVSKTNLVGTARDFVDAYNSIRENIDEVTFFDPEEQTTGILFGTTAVLRVESDLANILSGRFFGFGKFNSLESIGLSFDDKGKLSLNETKFGQAYADDAAALERFFTDKKTGLSARLTAALDKLVGDQNSLLNARTKTLDTKISNNEAQIEFMTDRLDLQRERLFAQFTQLESTVARLQQNLTALQGLQIIPPITSSSANSG